MANSPVAILNTFITLITHSDDGGPRDDKEKREASWAPKPTCHWFVI